MARTALRKVKRKSLTAILWRTTSPAGSCSDHNGCGRDTLKACARLFGDRAVSSITTAFTADVPMSIPCTCKKSYLRRAKGGAYAAYAMRQIAHSRSSVKNISVGDYVTLSFYA